MAGQDGPDTRFNMTLITKGTPSDRPQVYVRLPPGRAHYTAPVPVPPSRTRRLVLASASPARLAVLRAAGIEPVVHVSGVDEDAVAARLDDPTPEHLVTALARAKAEVVATAIASEVPDAVVVGCDSMLLFDGEMVGKPGTPEIARARWQRMAGHIGHLLTGHAVVRLDHGMATKETDGSQTTTVRFASPADHELEAYLATGEPNNALSRPASARSRSIRRASTAASATTVTSAATAAVATTARGACDATRASSDPVRL